MNILYHLTILPPQRPECEALSQEISALRSRFGGEVVYLNPNQHSPVYVPRLLFGFHKLRQLLAQEANLHLHHLYNPDPFPFPVLRRLRKPVVYTISSGIGDRRPNLHFLSGLAALTVYDECSLKRLKAWGLENCALVHPGIDTSRFTWTPVPLQSEIRLMVGSAPWTQSQFRTKGVDALLAAAQRSPQLRLVFLWRGVLAEEMKRRVHHLALEKQVDVLDQPVDVNQVLAGVHATVSLATDSAIIKSYPHSLIESLAAGKPVLVSGSIPMADYVEQTGCGQVVERVTPADVLGAVNMLASRYAEMRSAAQAAGQRDFAQEKMIASFQEVYEHVGGRASRP